MPSTADDSKQLNLAWAIVDPTDDGFVELTPETGAFTAFYKKKDVEGTISMQALKSQTCTSDQQDNFYPASFKDSAKTVAKYADSLKCLTDESIGFLQLNGDSESDQYQQIVFQFKYCD